MVNNTFILMMAMARRMLYLSIVVSSPSSDRTSVIPRYPASSRHPQVDIRCAAALSMRYTIDILLLPVKHKLCIVHLFL